MSITLKSDQEESIKALKKVVVSIKRNSATAMIESPVRVSKANNIERAIRTFQLQLRTLRCQLEERIHCKVPKGSPMMSWLINFTSDVLNRYKIHPNGRTNFEMTTEH